MRKAFVYRLYPTDAQARFMAGQLALACELYNACLVERREAYRRARKTLGYYDQANQRKDFHHKTALTLVRRYGLIAHEDLNVRGIARSRLAKSTHDAGWAAFLAILAHKAEEAGVVVIGVNPRDTTQVCSGCGLLPAQPKTLADRVHVCSCGLTLDRDENAARNIRALGLSVQAATWPTGACVA